MNEGPKHLGREIVEFQNFQEFEKFGAQDFGNNLKIIIILVNCHIQMSETEAKSIHPIAGCDRIKGGIWSRQRHVGGRLNRGVEESTNVSLWEADGSL